MYGEKRELITVQCKSCMAPCPIWLDREDLERAKRGLLVRDAFANRAGEPYLTPSERELFICGLCDRCWRMANGTASAPAACSRCGRPATNSGLCDEHFKLIQLCGSIGEFVARHAAYIDQELRQFACADPNGFAAARVQNLNGRQLLTADFYEVVMVFGLAEGSLVPSAHALALLAGLWSYVDPISVTSANAVDLAVIYANSFMENHPRPALNKPSCLSSFDHRDRFCGTQDGKVFRSLLFELAMAVATADGVVTGNEDRLLRQYAFLLDHADPDAGVHVQAARGEPRKWFS